MAFTKRHIHLFRNGCIQALRLTREFGIDGDEVINL